MRTGVDMKIKDVMSRRVVTLSPGNSVWHGAQIMVDQKISGIPVVDDQNALVGILTEGDLIRRTEIGRLFRKSIKSDDEAKEYVRSHSWNIGDVMTAPAITASEEMSLGIAAELMEEHNIKRLPVTRGQNLVGIVSRADLIRVVANSGPDTIAKGDTAIRISILARMREDLGISDDQLTVSVMNGVAHVWGNVSSKFQRDAIRVLVEGVPGVVRLESHMIGNHEEGLT